MMTRMDGKDLKADATPDAEEAEFQRLVRQAQAGDRAAQSRLFERYRDRLQRHVGLPVVEPSQAAVSMAIGRTRLAWG